MAVSERNALTTRILPSMVFSDGSPSSLTPSPPSKIENDAALGAAKRFSVQGNAIVTGGTGSLGLHACNALLEHGLQGLMIFDVDPSNSENDMTRMREKFPGVTIGVKKVDVTDEVGVAKAVDETVCLLGSVNALVCFAGIVGCVETLEMPVVQWRRILDINTTGCFICAQAVARKMVQQHSGGSITMVASISAHRVNYPQPQVAYNVSKAALLMLKSSLAAEWARYGIRTNTVSPGYMDTIHCAPGEQCRLIYKRLRYCS